MPCVVLGLHLFAHAPMQEKKKKGGDASSLWAHANATKVNSMCQRCEAHVVCQISMKTVPNDTPTLQNGSQQDATIILVLVFCLRAASVEMRFFYICIYVKHFGIKAFKF